MILSEVCIFSIRGLEQIYRSCPIDNLKRHACTAGGTSRHQIWYRLVVRERCKRFLFLAWQSAAEHSHRCNDDDDVNENWAAELRIESRWMMVWILEFIIFSMKWVFFECSKHISLFP